MKKTIIVDDETNSAEALERIIQDYCPKLDVIKVFTSPILALDFLLKEQIDLLFLDVNMPTMTGIELLKKIPNPSFKTIFTTAYEAYAIEAIKLDAVDYLLKPIDSSELVQTIHRIYLDDKQIDETTIQKPLVPLSNKLVINQVGNALFLKHADIIYLKSDNTYTDIVCRDRTVTASKTIKHFEGILPSPPFYRCHQSYIIHIDYITEYNRSEHTAILSNGQSVPISKNKKEGLFKLLQLG